MKTQQTQELVNLGPQDAATIALRSFIEDDYPIIRDTTEVVVVTNPEEYAAAGDWRKKVSDALKAIEERRKTIVDPLNKEVKNVNATFKVVSNLFEGLLTKLDAKMKPFAIQQQIAREQAAEIARNAELEKKEALQREIENAAISTGDEELLNAAVRLEEDKNTLAAKEIKVSKTTKGEDATVTLKKRWFYRVVDLSKIDRQFLSVDDKKIKAFMTDNDAALKDGKLTAPGLEFYADYDLSSRGR